MILLLLACTPPDPCTLPGASCRVAGTGQLGFNGEGLPALESWLYWPTSVEIAPDGSLVIVDFNNYRIRQLSDDGRLQTIAGNGAHSWSTPGNKVLESALENPVEVRFLPDGSFFIAALHEARVLYVDLDGNISVYAGSGNEGFTGDNGPASEADLSEAAGLALSEDGTLYIADTQNHCIRAVSLDGVITTLAGHGLAGYAGDGDDLENVMFNTPERIDWYDGSLYIADTNNNVIRRLDVETQTVSTIAGTGEAGFSGDDGPATEAQLYSPYGVDMAEDGNLYIADSGNNRVRKVGPDGIIHSIAGTGEAGLSGDKGPALDAQYDWPIDVVADKDGNVYIADMRNGAVRVVRPL